MIIELVCQGLRSGTPNGFKMEPRMLRIIENNYPTPRYSNFWDIEISRTLPWLWMMFLTTGMEIRNPKWIYYGANNDKSALKKVWGQINQSALRY